MKNFLRKLVLSNPTAYSDLKVEALDLLLALESEAKLTIAELRKKKTILRFGITEFQYSEVQNALFEKNDQWNTRKIIAIKLMRAYANLGLKTAKEAVENDEYFVKPLT